MTKTVRKTEGNRPGRPETRVLKIDLPVKEAVRRMSAYGLPRKKRKGTESKSGEPVKVSNQDTRDQARTAGTHRHGQR